MLMVSMTVLVKELVTVRRPVKTPRASRRCELLAVTYIAGIGTFCFASDMLLGRTRAQAALTAACPRELVQNRCNAPS
jgi:hypothetical protein